MKLQNQTILNNLTHKFIPKQAKPTTNRQKLTNILK